MCGLILQSTRLTAQMSQALPRMKTVHSCAIGMMTLTTFAATVQSTAMELRLAKMMNANYMISSTTARFAKIHLIAHQMLRTFIN